MNSFTSIGYRKPRTHSIITSLLWTLVISSWSPSIILTVVGHVLWSIHFIFNMFSILKLENRPNKAVAQCSTQSTVFLITLRDFFPLTLKTDSLSIFSVGYFIPQHHFLIQFTSVIISIQITLIKYSLGAKMPWVVK